MTTWLKITQICSFTIVRVKGLTQVTLELFEVGKTAFSQVLEQNKLLGFLDLLEGTCFAWLMVPSILKFTPSFQPPLSLSPKLG